MAGRRTLVLATSRHAAGADSGTGVPHLDTLWVYVAGRRPRYWQRLAAGADSGILHLDRYVTGLSGLRCW